MATTNSGLIKLLDAVIANVSGTYTVVNFRSGRAKVFMGGGFGGGTVTLFFKDQAGNAIPVKDGILGTVISCSAAAEFIIEIPYGVQISPTLAGATAATLTVTLIELKEMR